MAMEEQLKEISALLQRGRASKLKEIIQAALENGLKAETILEKGLMAGMEVVGEKFKVGKVFVPEVLMAAKAMNAGVELLRPYLVQGGVEEKGTIVIGTVKGDLHDIGKNLVKMMMEGKGLKVIDLGTDVSPEEFVSASQEHHAKVIACSALLTTTMNTMQDVVSAVKDAGLTESVRVMIGGAPVTQAFCDLIGADAYTPDAATAADVALSFCQQS